VTLIDFQDLIWGFEIQDVVIALQALDHFDGAEVFFEAFRAGYEEVRRWPEAEPQTIEALEAARHLNVLNFGLSMRKPGLEPFIARHAEPVAEWMARTTGR
jgi:Ser/Thr protein kinase RdoA (MazF antagonist)